MNMAKETEAEGGPAPRYDVVIIGAGMAGCAVA